uniref:HNH endonuclease n=1 Tax=Globodera pallida TaxID=36090 RepID=A0A183CTN4_GLOPA
ARTVGRTFTQRDICWDCAVRSRFELAPRIEDRFDRSRYTTGIISTCSTCSARKPLSRHVQQVQPENRYLDMFNKFSPKTVGGAIRKAVEQNGAVAAAVLESAFGRGIVDADVDFPWILDLTKDLLLTMVMLV